MARVYVSYAHNTLELMIFILPQLGGVVSIIVDRMVYKVDRFDKDFTGLGRWGWTQFNGRNGMHLRVFIVYYPCKTMGPKVAYAQ